jgi:substrate import-associated zinc metallohydrolase lipoprotein
MVMQVILLTIKRIKKMKKLLYIFSLTAFVLTFSSCSSEDDFTESIFDTNIPVVDESKATAPFDQWLNENFLIPYNVEIQYRFNFPASDKNFQLTPAEYNRSQLLAHFIRYLFYDVYTKYAGEEFMKQYGPRMFHFIGSTGYSPTTGTEVLGTAAGGVKITLYNVNEIKPWSETVDYTPSDVEVLNERIFHTMHHEFSHILHQTKSYPITYGQVTSGSYDPIDWQERDSVTTHQLGYVTHYASSANYEDFVETLSGIITDTDARWMNRIINACSPGLRQGDKERVYDLIDSLEVDIDNTEAHWNNFTLYSEKVYNQETGAYDESDRLVLDVHRSEEEVVNKESTAYVKKYSYTEYKKFTSFQEFMDWVPYKTDEGLAGMNAILKKIDIATEWYTNKWGLYVFELRREVRERQNNIDDYLHSDQVVIHNIE